MNIAKVFVIGPIGSPGSEKRRNADLLLDKVIVPAMDDLHYPVVRAERMRKPGPINRQVDYELRSTEIVIADLRDLNPNVMYELGIRQGLGLSCILLAPVAQKLPFNLQDYRTIRYPGDLEKVDQVKYELRGQVQEELKNNLTGRGSQWLYWHEIIERIEENVECGTIWVITPDLLHSTNCPFFMEAVKKNLQKGITYTYVFPKTAQTLALLDTLRGVFSTHPNLLTERPMREDLFRKMAVSHYLVLEPGACSDKPPQVFLELPIRSREYWIEVDRDAAQGFYSRFYGIVKGLPRRKNNGGSPQQENKTAMIAEAGKSMATKIMMGKE